MLEISSLGFPLSQKARQLIEGKTIRYFEPDILSESYGIMVTCDPKVNEYSAYIHLLHRETFLLDYEIPYTYVLELIDEESKLKTYVDFFMRVMAIENLLFLKYKYDLSDLND